MPTTNLNPFSTNVPLLYPLKTSKNHWFSEVFSGYRSGTLVENELPTVWKAPWTRGEQDSSSIFIAVHFQCYIISVFPEHPSLCLDHRFYWLLQTLTQQFGWIGEICLYSQNETGVFLGQTLVEAEPKSMTFNTIFVECEAVNPIFVSSVTTLSQSL